MSGIALKIRGQSLFSILWLMLAIVGSAMAAETDLTTLSLEQLSNLEVTSVSKKPERSFDAAAAVYVITQEDIHRSGVTSIPEALRLAPGVEVERIDANNWSIGIRGFTGGLLSQLSRSVLVLIDGRAVYNPLFAGTYWDVQNYPLDDIDRIEVIRGPGGTLWGANAVNGVINIITKSSKDTQGGLISAGAGSEEKAFGTTRYGGKIGSNGTYRVYGEYFDEGASFHPDNDNYDAWHLGQSGFRSDWDVSKEDQLTVQGDIYRGRAGETAGSTLFTNLFGANLLSRWSRAFDSKTGFTLQAYYDRTDRNPGSLSVSESRNTEDLDFQDRFALPGRQDIVWGAGYRVTADQTSSVGVNFFNPADQTLQTYSSFLQDTIAIIPDRFSFIAGTKLENNDYSGFEVQPSVRLLGTLTDRQTVWSAVSRAVRAPSRIDRDIDLNGEFNGSGVGSEKVIAYELGYRTEPSSKLSLDVSGFYNDYSDLETIETPIPITTVPIFFANNMEGYSEGIETALDVQVLPWWRMRGTYSLTDMKLRTKAGSIDTFSVALSEGETLRHTASLHWLFDLPHHTEIDPVLRYASKLAFPNTPAFAGLDTPAYAELDLRVAWHMTHDLELALVGQNLLHDHHAEFSTASTTSEIQRGIYGKVTWQWGR